MNASVVAAVVAAVAATAAAWLSYKASTRANQVSDRKVDLEEWRDQTARYKQIIDEQDRYNERLRSQIDRLNAQMDAVQAQLAKEYDVSSALRDQIRALQGQVRSLELLVDGAGPRRAGRATQRAD